MTKNKLRWFIFTLLTSVALTLPSCSGDASFANRNNNFPVVSEPVNAPVSTAPTAYLDASPTPEAAAPPNTNLTVEQSVSPTPFILAGFPTPEIASPSPASGPSTLEKALASGKPTLADFCSTT